MYPNASPDTCVLFLLRHGATENNLMKPPKLQGRGIDLSLSAEGKKQAQAAATVLATQKIAAVYTSTLARSRETGEIVAAPHEVPVQTVTEFVEVDVGRWEMRSWVDIEREEPEAYQRFQADPGLYGYAGGENLLQVAERARPMLQTIMQRHVGEQIVVVGHNVLNRALLADVLGLPLSRARHLHQENCCLNILECHDGQMKLVTLNAVGHLYD